MKSNKNIVTDFVNEIWNEKKITNIQRYLTDEFVDHSLPTGMPKNWEGTQKWIMATSVSFQHLTVIEDIISEGDKVFMRISMKLRHTGLWRNYQPTGTEVTTEGYRLFRISNGQITEHWATIDGSKIETAILGSEHRCKV
ncbi:ester cyclase [Sphingobacterium sp. 18053]|uniref:ester cyclase n=1 Tax=Sphingobacterium sp. 18053 TaxID=2681401 RepID=UPI0013589793|nr:ester cyclase [Sphingobacterium sp. 18053]